MATIESRTARDGEVSYRVKVRLRGAAPVSATFKRITDARRFVQDTESSIRDGRYFRAAEAKRHTLAEVIDRYCRDVLPRKPKAARTQGQQLAWWRKRLGHLLLSDVTSSVVAGARDDLARESSSAGRTRSPATVVRYLAALSHVFAVAQADFGWVSENPLRLVKKPREPRGRVRFLSDEERERLLAACEASESKALCAIVVLALSSGMRRGEILGLRWEDVDLRRRVLVLHDTKNGERRRVPLVGRAADELIRLNALRESTERLVFPGRAFGKPLDIKRAWETALRRAEIEDFRFHDLRHCAASYLAMSGATLAEIAEVLGHKTLAMVKRYSHLTEAHTRGVVERMNSRIFDEQKAAT